jgi:hypothetical protein
MFTLCHELRNRMRGGRPALAPRREVTTAAAAVDVIKSRRFIRMQAVDVGKRCGSPTFRRPPAGLDFTPPALKRLTLHSSNIMGQQLNKIIKRKRRAAYLKRKNERTKAAAKKK